MWKLELMERLNPIAVTSVWKILKLKKWKSDVDHFAQRSANLLWKEPALGKN